MQRTRWKILKTSSTCSMRQSTAWAIWTTRSKSKTWNGIQNDWFKVVFACSMIYEFCCRAKKHLLDESRRKHEDLEFQLMELEAKYESELEDIQNRLVFEQDNLLNIFKQRQVLGRLGSTVYLNENPKA